MLKNLIIINKALKATVRKFKNCNISKSFWYGEANKEPYNIAFWIFFKNDSDLLLNSENGTTKEIEMFLFSRMLELGYPKMAFDENILIYDKIFVMVGDKKVKDASPIKRTTLLMFGSSETVKREYKGDYYLYTK